MERRRSDAEAELNMPPGFRFHPTDEELVVHYLGRKVAGGPLPVPIIADVDLYKYDPWQLPEKALFGQREWYFFTPRGRKYPKGSRPNRAAGQGYWKATGADKPVSPEGGGSRPLGIKKALVFYSGKAPHGIKTDWIMHEYRLVGTTCPSKKGNTMLDQWVLCRLYNKRKTWEKMQSEKYEASSLIGEAISDSFRMPADYSEVGGNGDFAAGLCWSTLRDPPGHQMTEPPQQKEEHEWFVDMNLDDDLQSPFADLSSNPEYLFSELSWP